MTTQENELFVTIRNDKGEPVCTVEWAVAERLGWLEEQGAAEGDKVEAPAAAPEAGESGGCRAADSLRVLNLR